MSAYITMTSADNDEKQRAEVIKKCREYFKGVDTNGDGKINRMEFAKMIDELGMNLDKKEMMLVNGLVHIIFQHSFFKER